MERYLERYRAGEVPSDPNWQVHESHVFRSRGGYVWCQQCGAYYSSAEPRIRLLKRECQVPSQQGRANLKRIREGLPPGNLASQLAIQLAKRLGTLSPGHALAPSRA